MSSLPEPRAGFVERRRHPRIAADQLEIFVRDVCPVEVLDISSTGALLSTERGLEVGQRAQLRTLLEREPFAGWIEVRRIADETSSANTSKHRLGVVFTSFDENSRKVLQRFTRSQSREP